MSARTSGLVIVFSVYVIATLSGAFVALFLHTLPMWLRLLLADVVATCVVFVGSRVFDNSSVYDPYWTVYPIVAGFGLLASVGLGAEPVARRLVVLALVTVWGVRLTYNWVRGFGGMHHEDWRYVDIRARTGGAYWAASFFALHLFPTVLTYLGSLSLIVAMAPGKDGMNLLDGAACVVTCGAILLEGVADQQLYRFRRDNQIPGKIMDSGLWSLCRHPNYLGEMMFWWGLFLFALAADAGAAYALVGPVGITLLFVFGTVRLIDQRSLARRPGYAEHMRRIPALIPKLW